MSVRRPAPLVAQHEVLTVGALADRLPGSTRLSQVLAAGAKHLAKHKTADTEAPKRDLFGRDIGFRTTNARPIIAYWLNKLKEKVLEYMRAQAAGNFAALPGLTGEVHDIVNTIFHKIGGIDDMEILRRQGAYFLLNWFYQHGTPQQSSDAQKVLGIALHEENNKEFENILLNLHQGVEVLGLADGPALALAHPDRGGVVLNGPGPSNYTEARKKEKRQKVDDERDAKFLQRQQDKQDGKISEKLEAQQDAEGLQDDEVVPGQNAKDAARKKAEERAGAQGDNLGGAVGGSGDYDDVRGDATDDEEDEFEGDPQAQQVGPNPPRKK